MSDVVTEDARSFPAEQRLDAETLAPKGTTQIMPLSSNLDRSPVQTRTAHPCAVNQRVPLGKALIFAGVADEARVILWRPEDLVTGFRSVSKNPSVADKGQDCFVGGLSAKPMGGAGSECGPRTAGPAEPHPAFSDSR